MVHDDDETVHAGRSVDMDFFGTLVTTPGQGSPGHGSSSHSFFARKCDRVLFCAATKSDSTAAGQRELNSKLVGPSSKAKNIQKFLYA